MHGSNKLPGFATRAIHHGYDPQDHGGALVPPVYQTATFTFPTVEYGAACFAGEQAGHFYSRISNPTLNLLEARMASLEGGEVGLALGLDIDMVLQQDPIDWKVRPDAGDYV